MLWFADCVGGLVVDLWVVCRISLCYSVLFSYTGDVAGVNMLLM